MFVCVWFVYLVFVFFFFQAEDGIRDGHVTGVQTCALPISWKRNTYFATNMPRTSGTVVATAPHRKRPMPCVFRPLTKPGPAEMPTMAMKMLRPTEFMNQTVGVGMRPNFGRTERSQPPMIPAISAPPAVDRVSGAPATLKTSEPINAPTTI